MDGSGQVVVQMREPEISLLCGLKAQRPTDLDRYIHYIRNVTVCNHQQPLSRYVSFLVVPKCAAWGFTMKAKPRALHEGEFMRPHAEHVARNKV